MDDVISFKCILESWKSNVDLVKSSLDQASDLVEGMWGSCSDILEEWEIRENGESLDTNESLAPNIEVIKHVRASLVTDIEELATVDSKTIHFSLLAPIQLATRVFDHNRIVEKGIKEIDNLVIQGHIHSPMTKGPKAEEIININNKWKAWDEYVRKTSIV